MQTSLCGIENACVHSDAWCICMRICKVQTQHQHFSLIAKQTSFKQRFKQRLPFVSHSLVVLYYNILNFIIIIILVFDFINDKIGDL